MRGLLRGIALARRSLQMRVLQNKGLLFPFSAGLIGVCCFDVVVQRKTEQRWSLMRLCRMRACSEQNKRFEGSARPLERETYTKNV